MADVPEMSDATPEFTDVQSEAFERLKDEILAVPEDDVLTINVDMPLAVSIVLGAWSQLVELRPRIEKLAEFDLPQFDKIEAYAYATAQTHGDYVLATTPTESLPQLYDQGVILRELMVSNAMNLAKHGLLDGEHLKALKGPVGYRNLAVDLTALASFLRQSWTKIAGKTPLTPTDLETAAILGARLLKGVGVKERAPITVAETALTRQRAFTLLARAYDQARRAVRYLRWNEDDADQIAPSLYTGRNNGRRRSDSEVAPPTPVAGAQASADDDAQQPPAQVVPAGHPGGNPLLS